MNRFDTVKRAIVGVTVATSLSLASIPGAHAQQPLARAMLMHIQAQIVGVDAATNSVTLRGPRGNVAVMEVRPEVADVSKLRVGDTVDIAYQNAILVRAEKIQTSGIRSRVETEVTRPASDGVVTTARKVEVVATVQKIDRKHHKVTLRGPDRTEEFDVVPDVSLDGLKVGDSINAVFLAAAAAAVTRDGVEVK
ncbi:copper-binding protein [Paraburkholderia sp.]|uniref:copper-binding protein n=1 Tax=Paraburkholderia sp. TaxID=1926495 RepID=UPI00238D8B7A|nr:copper-binding protein [Paraburkholderia sp.]MDE1178999.1 copper-binding protein [Paraburkholderia sp.]